MGGSGEDTEALNAAGARSGGLCVRWPGREMCLGSARPAISEITDNKGREEAMSGARLKHFGWGREGEGMTAEEEAFALGVHRRRFGVSDFDSIAVPTLADVRLRAPRIAPPAALAAICSTETYDRAAHAHGKGFTDAVRAMLNDFASAPDAVAYPRTSRTSPR